VLACGSRTRNSRVSLKIAMLFLGIYTTVSVILGAPSDIYNKEVLDIEEKRRGLLQR